MNIDEINCVQCLSRSIAFYPRHFMICNSLVLFYNRYCQEISTAADDYRRIQTILHVALTTTVRHMTICHDGPSHQPEFSRFTVFLGSRHAI